MKTWELRYLSRKLNTKNKNHCRDWELLLLSDYYYYCFLRWLKPLCYEISLLSSLYITCHIHRSVFLSQTNRRRVYIKACKGSSYEINQWKISLFSKFNFLFQNLSHNHNFYSITTQSGSVVGRHLGLKTVATATCHVNLNLNSDLLLVGLGPGYQIW